jgi:hypothetical protein
MSGRKVSNSRVEIQVCYAQAAKSGTFLFFEFLCWTHMGYGEVISDCELWNAELKNAERSKRQCLP